MGNKLSVTDAVADGSYERKLLKFENQYDFLNYAVEVEDWELFRNMLNILYEQDLVKNKQKIGILQIFSKISESYYKPKKILEKIFESAFKSNYGRILYETIVAHKYQYSTTFREISENTHKVFITSHADLSPKCGTKKRVSITSHSG